MKKSPNSQYNLANSLKKSEWRTKNANLFKYKSNLYEFAFYSLFFKASLKTFPSKLENLL